uniref:ABC transporter B family member 9-like n=1 Tax=Rhizophora mucronata TaxID=61149 RepID=A0A2P2MIF7_RHIMU
MRLACGTYCLLKKKNQGICNAKCRTVQSVKPKTLNSNHKRAINQDFP